MLTGNPLCSSICICVFKFLVCRMNCVTLHSTKAVKKYIALGNITGEKLKF